MLVSVAAGLLTVKVWLPLVPPPGPLFVTEKLRAPVAAAVVTVMFAVIWVALSTVVLLTVMPAPTLPELTPVMNPAPLNVTSNVASRSPDVGEIAVSVGAGLFTVKVWLPLVPPPGPLLVTEKLWAPVAAAAVTVMFAVIWVALSTVVVLTVMPAPTFTELTPVMNPV